LNLNELNPLIQKEKDLFVRIPKIFGEPKPSEMLSAEDTRKLEDLSVLVEKFGTSAY
jgi:hypothetical protein